MVNPIAQVIIAAIIAATHHHHGHVHAHACLEVPPSTLLRLAICAARVH